jgi:soluble lytic murein transglycosylase-like protein
VARVILHAAALAMVFGGTVTNGRAQSVEDDLLPVIHEAADAYGVSRAWLYRTLRCESGGFRADVVYGPTTGAAGERGIAQLHPSGLLPLFRSKGYTSAYDPSQAIWFAAWAFGNGLASHWTCSRA